MSSRSSADAGISTWRGDAAGQTLGVIDIGSNSGRVMVARVRGAAHLDVLGDARSPLRLVRDVARGGELSAETIERTLRIVRGFVAVASSARRRADRGRRHGGGPRGQQRRGSSSSALAHELGHPGRDRRRRRGGALRLSRRGARPARSSTASCSTSAAAACSWSTSASGACSARGACRSARCG